MKKLKAALFYYIVRPIMNRTVKRTIVTCPCCRELLEYYDDSGLLHLADGDADCYGALGAGKGRFK